MTRNGFIMLAACASFWPGGAYAQQPELTGVWKLNSFVAESVQTRERRNVYGEKPSGYLVITPERFTAIVTGEGRKPPKTDEDGLFSFRSMLAYTGLYRIEGNRLTTKCRRGVERSLEGDGPSKVFFHVQGDRLLIESAPTVSVNYPELGQIRAILEWERSK